MYCHSVSRMTIIILSRDTKRSNIKIIEKGKKMRKNNFSNEISKLATVPQAQERYKVSRRTVMNFAEQYNAVVRFGKSVRIDCERLDKVLNENKTIASITS